MSKKKTLVAIGYYKEDGSVDEKFTAEEADEAIEELIKAEAIEELIKAGEVVEEHFFCQFCDKFFETEKGVSIHEKRWCKERPVEVKPTEKAEFLGKYANI